MPVGLVPAAPLAIQRGLELPVRRFRGLPQTAQRNSETRSQRLHLASSRSEPLLIALPIVGSACGSPGEGIAGPPAHIIAFQALHSSRSASRILTSAALRIR